MIAVVYAIPTMERNAEALLEVDGGQGVWPDVQPPAISTDSGTL